jgi:hypothetical protein
MSKDGELIRLPFRLVVCDLSDNVAGLACPICGNTYVHPAKVAVEQGSTKTVVVHEATCVQPTDRGSHHRGSEISLAFWCEGGHRFEYRMAFQKGHLFCELLACCGGPYLSDAELWRN